uniref:Uncharacterized protein n=1 Tax=Anguilla anguilla TaxID=7936 RepID=A0A0E9RLF8_ANGAN
MLEAFCCYYLMTDVSNLEIESTRVHHRSIANCLDSHF